MASPFNSAWGILKYLGGPDQSSQYRQDMAGENEVAFQDEFESMGPNDLKHLYDMIEAYKEQARHKDQLIDALRNQLSVLQGQTPEEMYSPQQLDTQRPSNLTCGKYSHLLPETNFE